MNWILMLVFYFIGMGVASFTLIVFFIVLFFGIPTTKKLEKKGMLKPNNGIVKKYTFTLIFQPAFYLLVLWAINTWFPIGTIPFIVGTVFSFLFGMGQIGANKNNVTDYVETNERHLTVHKMDAVNAILGNRG